MQTAMLQLLHITHPNLYNTKDNKENAFTTIP